MANKKNKAVQATANQTEIKENTSVITLNSTTDKLYTEKFTKFCELVENYKTLNELKGNKKTIIDTLCIDYVSYSLLLGEYKKAFNKSITDEIRVTKLATKNFVTALHAAFVAAKNNKEFANKIAVLQASNKKFDVWEFVKQNYSFTTQAQNENFYICNILVPSYKFYTNVNNELLKATILVPLQTEKQTFSKAYAIVINCINNFFQNCKNEYYNNSLRLNVFCENTIIKITKFDTEFCKFNQTKFTEVPADYSEVSSEFAKGLTSK